jgi:sigma-B regulation protein RsbU (phosphoserine phosphatase)
MVSGDYYDYQLLMDHKVAIALGDVAGKGISAALLMATVGSSLRTQLRNSLEGAAAPANGDSTAAIPTSQLVAQLNKQIFNDTAPEKYLTFYFGIYDDESSELTYTNAGHLPPLVIRNGHAIRLEVNGTVVGAFPFSEYDETTIKLEPGDLLACYTDGITEPENDYGEMFGEERLIDVLVKHADRPEQEMLDAVMGAVRQWTGSPELQDDMTLLLARRL